MKRSIIFSSIITVLFTGCLGGESSTQEWTSLIYPDKNNIKRSKKFGVFKTLEECQKESKNELTKLGLTNRGDYQCGLNCKFHDGMKVDICEKLVK